MSMSVGSLTYDWMGVYVCVCLNRCLDSVCAGEFAIQGNAT